MSEIKFFVFMLTLLLYSDLNTVREKGFVELKKITGDGRVSLLSTSLLRSPLFDPDTNSTLTQLITAARLLSNPKSSLFSRLSNTYRSFETHSLCWGVELKHKRYD